MSCMSEVPTYKRLLHPSSDASNMIDCHNLPMDKHVDWEPQAASVSWQPCCVRMQSDWEPTPVATAMCDVLLRMVDNSTAAQL